MMFPLTLMMDLVLIVTLSANINNGLDTIIGCDSVVLSINASCRRFLLME